MNIARFHRVVPVIGVAVVLGAATSAGELALGTLMGPHRSCHRALGWLLMACLLSKFVTMDPGL